MLVKLFTPVPPVHVQLLTQATLLPLTLVMEAQETPEVALEAPHWSRRIEYWMPVSTVSHWPQWEEVSRAETGESEARARRETSIVEERDVESDVNARKCDAEQRTLYS